MAKRKDKRSRGDLTLDDFVKRAPELTVLTDHPLSGEEIEETFADDPFNFRYKLGPVFDILRHPDTKTPAAILISGGWGTGKTSAMKWLECLLEKWNKSEPKGGIKVRPVWFYPWKYDNKEDVRRGLIAEVIINSIDVKTASTQTVINAAKQFGLFLGKSFLHVLASIKLKPQVSVEGGPVKPQVGAEIDLASIKEILTEYQKAAHPENAFLNEFERELGRWIKNTLASNERMVIFIDDLDRCMPDIALQVLEALKLYLNTPNLVFVLGVHKKVIDKLVKEHYKKLGLSEDESKDYLAKMFQVEVELDPSERQTKEFLGEQLKDIEYWAEPHLSKRHAQIFQEVIFGFAGRNPREVKRLLNGSLMAGAGAIMMGDEGLSLAQGMQLFFVRKILDERYTMSTVISADRGTEFFGQWSQIVRDGREKDPNFPLTVKVPSDFGKEPQKELDVEEKTRRRLDNVFVPFAREEYHELLKNPKFLGLLLLLADEDLGELMQIQYPSEAAEVANVVGTSKDADIIREAVARQLKKRPDEVTDEDYRKTTILSLTDSGISDISALKHFPDLQELYLGGTPVIDIRPLASLANLRKLRLYSTQVSDIGPLAPLTNLQELYLGGTQVRDIGPVASLTNLQQLYLGGIQVSEIGPLAGLANLQRLSLADTEVSEIGPLVSLKNLQTLYLTGTHVSHEQVAELQKALPNLNIER